MATENILVPVAGFTKSLVGVVLSVNVLRNIFVILLDSIFVKSYYYAVIFRKSWSR